MKPVRIIPVILTDGMTVVKGSNFDNWRTVGNAEATARLFAAREVDELMFLDVTARKRGTRIPIPLVEQFSRILDIPFSVGGGISTLEEAKSCFRHGAEKVVIGTAAVTKPGLINEIASTFGSQAVVAAIDLKNSFRESVLINSGSQDALIDALSLIRAVEAEGAGEILLQSKSREGQMAGYDLESIRNASLNCHVPLIASSGCGGAEDAIAALHAGADAVAVGALFNFSSTTPGQLREEIRKSGFRTRVC